MRKDLLSKLFANLDIRGFEPDDDKDDKDDESGSEESEDDNQEDGDEQGKNENTDNLKSALRKERLERKRLEKEAKELRKLKEEQENKDKSESDLAKEIASKAESKALKLAEKLKVTAVDNAIIKLGGKLKFRDIDDALKLVDRGAIEVEQDDDDPADITIDEGTVETALKELAKKKPHLIIAEGQGEPSGSKFNGGRKSQKEMDDEVLKSTYKAFGTSKS